MKWSELVITPNCDQNLKLVIAYTSIRKMYTFKVSKISKIYLKDKQNTFLLIQPEIKMSYGTDFYKVFV